jgi:catechol 2,3-dioxygenase-like lactoylglutathione lyase family enzyme
MMPRRGSAPLLLLGHYAQINRRLRRHAMPLSKLEHYLVMTSDLEATREFYCRALGFADGFRPDLGFPGYWLYLGTTPVIHIAEWRSYTAHSQQLGLPVTSPAAGTGALDHIAFHASDYEAFVAQLIRHGVTVHRHDSPAAGLRQLFLQDPNGIKLEINFFNGA